MKKDGHIHTPFCPHGSNDSFEKYIEKAIAHNFTEITFTEHAPLPNSFMDPTPNQNSGMDPNSLLPYLEKLSYTKKQYENHIIINIGLEIDYISGYEKETRNFLDEVGPLLDDAILSVHFLQYNNHYTCVDFSEEVYLQFAREIGSVKDMYHLYYETVRQSIDADLGTYKPKRIGHPTLIHKFQHALDTQIDDDLLIKELLLYMKEKGYEMDLNSAGLSKTLCKEPYPPFHIIDFAKSIHLPYVFGSDAHTARDLHQHYNVIFP
ncbi:histidinol-phosphatase HisJ [Solibacillus sp. CAU 1738]|uniref:histidinol-phosphatase HisJ n=1 Tax=Solibacillus sp. CAU 1738 TaxID=3140363 RepID=UPI003260AC47